MAHKLKNSQNLYSFPCLYFSHSLSSILFYRYIWGIQTLYSQVGCPILRHSRLIQFWMEEFLMLGPSWIDQIFSEPSLSGQILDIRIELGQAVQNVVCQGAASRGSVSGVELIQGHQYLVFTLASSTSLLDDLLLDL